MILEFTLDIDPPTATAQEQKTTFRGGYVRRYDPPNVKAAKALLKTALAPHAPETPITGPVALDITWHFTSASHKPGTWRTTRPDLDNLQKGLKDCMTAVGFWADDSQVCFEISRKQWSAAPCIEISITEMKEGLV
jgi:Holliday junction resolvase RusA-like endonuclease